jgi:hypothetical protein
MNTPRSAPVSTYQQAARLLAVRALQLQARGDAAAGLDHLLWALALSRNLRHLATQATYQEGQAVEAIALQGLDRWLERLGPQADLLQRALEELNQHEEETPGASEPVKAEYLILRGRLDQPAAGLFYNSGYSATALLERDLVSLTLLTPWERERAVRFLDALVSSRLKDVLTPYWQLPLQARLENRIAAPVALAALAGLFVPDGKDRPFHSGSWERLLADSHLLMRLFPISFQTRHEQQAFALCRVRAARLKLALAFYQVQERKPAPSLAHLVPRYMETMPLDPFSGQLFHYRVSTGQHIEWRTGGEHPEGTDIPVGQGILWTVGPEPSGTFGMRGTPFVDGAGREHFLIAPDQLSVVPAWLH